MSIQSVKGHLIFPLYVAEDICERPHLRLDCQTEKAEVIMVNEKAPEKDEDVLDGRILDFPLAGATEEEIADFLVDNRVSIEVVMLASKLFYGLQSPHNSLVLTANLRDCEPHLGRLQGAAETFRSDRVGTANELEVFTSDKFKEIVGSQEEAQDYLDMSDYSLVAAFEDCAGDSPIEGHIYAPELRAALNELLEESA